MPSPFVIIVPARGGSERVPRKNLAPLNGKPLLLHTLEQIGQAGLRDIAYISTDDADIASMAAKANVAVIDRPRALATSTASTEAVLLHALDTLAARDIHPSWVITIPPTSPLRRPETICAFMQAAEQETAHDCLFSVTERVERFWKQLPTGAVAPIFPDAPPNQQERRARGLILLEENSVIYVTRVSALREAAARGAVAPIFGQSARGIAIDPLEGLDINTPADIAIATAVLHARENA